MTNTNEKRLMELTSELKKLPRDDLFFNTLVSVNGTMDRRAREYFKPYFPNIIAALEVCKNMVNYITVSPDPDIEHVLSSFDIRNNNIIRSLSGARYLILLYGAGKDIEIHKTRELEKFIDLLTEILDCIGYRFKKNNYYRHDKVEVLTR